MKLSLLDLKPGETCVDAGGDTWTRTASGMIVSADGGESHWQDQLDEAVDEFGPFTKSSNIFHRLPFSEGRYIVCQGSPVGLATRSSFGSIEHAERYMASISPGWAPCIYERVEPAKETSDDQ